MNLFSVKTEKSWSHLSSQFFLCTSPREIDRASLNELKSKLIIIVCRENSNRNWDETLSVK